MKIKRKENYKIYLYQEPSIISDHSKSVLRTWNLQDWN